MKKNKENRAWDMHNLVEISKKMKKRKINIFPITLTLILSMRQEKKIINTTLKEKIEKIALFLTIQL